MSMPRQFFLILNILASYNFLVFEQAEAKCLFTSLSNRIASANIIVVGIVENSNIEIVNENSRKDFYSPHSHEFDVTVDQVIKGDVPSKSIHFKYDFFPNVKESNVLFDNGTKFIFFLKNLDGNQGKLLGHKCEYEGTPYSTEVVQEIKDLVTINSKNNAGLGWSQCNFKNSKKDEQKYDSAWLLSKWPEYKKYIHGEK